jgi:hypothetical protein
VLSFCKPNSQVEALGFLYKWKNLDPLNNSPRFIEGTIRFVLFKLGIGIASTEKEHLATLYDMEKSRFQDLAVVVRQEARDIIVEAKNSLTQAQNDLSEQRTLFQSEVERIQGFNTEELPRRQQEVIGFLHDAKNQVDTTLSDFNTRIEEIKNTFHTKMALEAPVTYWQKKSTHHLYNTIIFGTLTIISFFLVSWFLYHTLSDFFGDTSTTHPVEYWRIGSFLLFASLGIWIVRIFVRLLLSNIHLRTDADERVTMIQTFLALASDGKIDTEKSLLIILEALFRPASTGVVRDDAAPASPLEMLTRTRS